MDSKQIQTPIFARMLGNFYIFYKLVVLYSDSTIYKLVFIYSTEGCLRLQIDLSIV